VSSLDRASPEAAVILDLKTSLGRDFVEVGNATNIVVVSTLVLGDATLGSIAVELGALGLECVNRVGTVEGPVDFFESGTTFLILAMLIMM